MSDGQVHVGNHWYAFMIYKQPYWINYTRRRQIAT